MELELELKQTTTDENLKFKDISHERYRIYTFPKKETIRIERPVFLNVSPSGGHRIQDSANKAHYVPSGWLEIYWETDNEVCFNF